MRMRAALLITGLACLAWLSKLAGYAAGADPGADADADLQQIVWLPVTQTSPPSKIARLRDDLLTFLEPLRRRLFGPPKAVQTTAHFVEIIPGSEAHAVLPGATSTNIDGTVAHVLSPIEFSSLWKRLQVTRGAEEMASPRATSLEGQRARISITGGIQIDKTNATFGRTVDLVQRVSGKTFLMRVLTELTAPTTNAAASASIAGAEASPPLVRIQTVFQVALEARVLNGGALAIWGEPQEKDEPIQLILVCPFIPTGQAAPATRPKPPDE